jgi:arylsulfatase A-like enzyme
MRDHGKYATTAQRAEFANTRGRMCRYPPGSNGRRHRDTIQEHGWAEFGKWHLGVNDEAGDETKARYTFPYGDFEKVHRCGLLAAESRSGQYEHFDIELAVAHLHGMLEMAAEVSRV